jgi:hypothetical protein
MKTMPPTDPFVSLMASPEWYRIILADQQWNAQYWRTRLEVPSSLIGYGPPVLPVSPQPLLPAKSS